MAFVLALFLSLAVNAQSAIDSAPTLDGHDADLTKYRPNPDINSVVYTKFSVFLNASGEPDKVMFQNSGKFAFHSDYLLTRPEFKGLTRSQIDAISMSQGPQRKLVLGTVFYDNNNGPMSFEIVSTDLTPVPLVGQIRDLLDRSSPLTLKPKTIRYLAVGGQRQGILAQAADLKQISINVLDPGATSLSSVYYQGWTAGRVLLAKAADIPTLLKNGLVTRETILVLDSVPREIPPVAGVLSAQPTASSSHVNLLAEMMQIPFAYDANILKLAGGFDGQKVLLKLNQQGIAVFNTVSDVDYDRLRSAKVRAPIHAGLDSKTSAIVKTESLQESGLPAYGGKAVRMGLLRRLWPQNTPSATAAVPLSYFRQYLDTAKTPQGEVLAQFIASRLHAATQPTKTYAEMMTLMKEVREQMQATAVPAALVDQIRSELRKLMPGVDRVKLRSSSNIEDGSEFNGAGLYDSEGVWLDHAPVGKENDFERGLNKVWRSLYTDRGFLARRMFLVDESQVGMAILVNTPFKGEVANGVSLWVKDQYAAIVTVTGFPGEETTVTNPTTTDRPEITEMWNWNPNEWNITLKQASTLVPLGQTLLSEAEYTELAQLMDSVAQKWPGGAPAAGLNFEWKVMVEGSGRKVYLKQVRPLPAKVSEKLNDGSTFFVPAQKGYKLDVTIPERTEAFGQLFCPQSEVVVDLPSFSEQDMRRGGLVIPRVEFTLRGKKYSMSSVPTKSVLPTANGQGGLEFTVASDLSPGHRFFLRLGNMGANPEFIVAELSGDAKGDRKTLAVAQPFFNGIEDYSCYLAPKDIWSAGPGAGQIIPLRSLISLPSTNQSILYEGEYRVKTGYDKTFTYQVQRTVLTGFLPHPITVTQPQGVVYAPAHHNFGWGVTVDMEASDLSAAERSAFYQQYGRYLLFETGRDEAVWLKPNGQMSAPVHAVDTKQ